MKFLLLNSGHEKQIDPETFRDFYTCWKETEAEAQEVSLPALLTDHLDKNECVYKLSSSVKTNRGVGKIAMTQKRLFLLPEGRPGYVEIATFRNIEVRVPWCQVQNATVPQSVCPHAPSAYVPFCTQLGQLSGEDDVAPWGASVCERCGQHPSPDSTVVTMYGGTR